MKISDRAEEILETLWRHIEEDKKEPMDLGITRGDTAIDELLDSGNIKLINDKVILTEKGIKAGRQIVRRHRLAECLFAGVLDVKKNLIHQVSCQFEHLIYEGIEENICSLLGHPKTCPHGKTIPSGECCRTSKETIEKVISSLVNCKSGQKGKVAYIYTKDHKKLQKLMAMGVLPGMSITLIQKLPSFVFQIGQSQFAIDKELAECIIIRIPN